MIMKQQVIAKHQNTNIREAPPTDLNARTGELTPPGIKVLAFSKYVLLKVPIIFSYLFFDLQPLFVVLPWSSIAFEDR